jgi:hypothetical protein
MDSLQHRTAPSTGSSERRLVSNERVSERRPMALPARLTWKDQRGATRFASVITRNVSDYGVYVECLSPFSIPLFRLVQFQLERDAREQDPIPSSLKQGRLVSAVYRVTPATPSGGRQGLALRQMVDPRRRTSSQQPAQATA